MAETPSAQPLQARPGQQVTLGLTFRNQSSSSGTLNLLVFPRDPGNRTRGTIGATFNISPRGTATPQLSYLVPSDAASGPWGLQVFVWDSRTFVGGDTSTYLVNRLYEGMFRV